MLKPRAEELILDVGTGTGIRLKDAVRYGAVLVGLDISKDMLRLLPKMVEDEDEWIRISPCSRGCGASPVQEACFPQDHNKHYTGVPPKSQTGIGGGASYTQGQGEHGDNARAKSG